MESPRWHLLLRRSEEDGKVASEPETTGSHLHLAAYGM
jgi:hypothetical protein